MDKLDLGIEGGGGINKCIDEEVKNTQGEEFGVGRTKEDCHCSSVGIKK